VKVSAIHQLGQSLLKLFDHTGIFFINTQLKSFWNDTVNGTFLCGIKITAIRVISISG